MTATTRRRNTAGEAPGTERGTGEEGEGQSGSYGDGALEAVTPKLEKWLRDPMNHIRTLCLEECDARNS